MKLAQVEEICGIAAEFVPLSMKISGLEGWNGLNLTLAITKQCFKKDKGKGYK